MLYAAVTEILFRLRIGEPEMRKQLAAFYRPSIKITVGVVTGETSHMFKLRKIEVEDVAWS